MSKRSSLPLLRREYIGFNGFLGHLSSDSPHQMPSWCDSGSMIVNHGYIEDKIPVLRTMVEKNRNYPTLKDPAGRCLVHLICSVNSPGQVEVLRIFCSANKEAVNALDHMNRTPLHHAVSLPNLEYHTRMNSGAHLVQLIKELIKLGAKVNALDVHLISPLHMVMHAGSLTELPAILQMFIDAGVDASLLMPARNRMYGILDYIQEDDIEEDDHFAYPDRTSALHLACRMTGPLSVQSMKILFTSFNVNCRDSFQRTPLHDLIISIGQTPREFRYVPHNGRDQRIFLAKFIILIELGANVNAKDVLRATPLCLAVQKHRYPVSLLAIKALLINGATVDVTFSNQDITPIHLLCQNFDQFPGCLPRFLRAGAQINGMDGELQTPLFYALKNGNTCVDTVKFLCRLGADVMATDNENNNCLHVVCREQQPKSVEMVRYLVSKGCPINARNNDGDSPLFLYLRQEGDKDFVENLIRIGADVHVTNANGFNVLHIISQFSSRWTTGSAKQMVQMMIEKGVSVKAKDVFNLTPLVYELRGHTDERIVSAMLAAGADPNQWTDEAPLLMTISKGNFALTQVLLDFGADVNVMDSLGHTPLHRATASTIGGLDRIMMVLIDGGADPTITNFHDRTPLMSMTFRTYEFFTPYIAILIATGRYSLREEEKNFFSSAPLHSFSNCLTNCINQAPLLNDTFINAHTTVAEFLLEPADRVRRLLRNPEIQDILHSVQRSCNQLSIFIKGKYELMDHLNHLEDRAISFFNNYSSGRLPLLIIERILMHLTYADMVSLFEIMVYTRSNSE